MSPLSKTGPPFRYTLPVVCLEGGLPYVRYSTSFLILCCASLISQAQGPAPRLFSRLTVNQTHSASRTRRSLECRARRGEAKRLTNHAAEETSLLFTGTVPNRLLETIGGNWDIYVMACDRG